MGLAAIGGGLSEVSRSGGAGSGPPPTFESALMASRSLKARPVNLTPAQSFEKPQDRPGPASPAIPRADADPKQVAAWWGGLPGDARETLIRDRHAELGPLRGLPAKDADRVNRLRVDEDVSKLGGALDTLEMSIDGRRSIGMPISGEDRARQKTLRTELSNAEKIRDQINDLDRGHRDGSGPQPYLLTYAHQGAGNFAVALGDPDRARNTAMFVPGATHDVRHEKGPFQPVEQGRRIWDQMNAEDQIPDEEPATRRGAEPNAVIVWLGADMPDQAVPAGMNPTYGDAKHGARKLRDDVAGYQASIAAAQGDADRNMTIVAHSYGSYMTGQAMKIGMSADDVVFIGSPGVGAADVGDLGRTGQIWAGEAKGDVIADVPWFGRNPTDDDFGAKVFATDGSRGHSGYLIEGTESLENIARIATGQDRMVELRAPN